MAAAAAGAQDTDTSQHRYVFILFTLLIANVTDYPLHVPRQCQRQKKPKKQEMTEMRPQPPTLRMVGGRLDDNPLPSIGHNMHDERFYEDRSVIWVGAEWCGRFCFVFSGSKVVKINVFLQLNMLEIPTK